MNPKAPDPTAPALNIDLAAIPSLKQLEAELNRRKRNKIDTLFPESGPLRRELYVRHMDFFRATLDHSECLFLAANRVGKTVAGSYCCVVHATGLYPPWWEGKRFSQPVTVWACNQTGNDTKDINQLELLGKVGEFGTGLLPADTIIQTKPRPSIPDAIGTIYVKHVTGGRSVIYLKSYDQGRTAFQGRAVEVIWADEEVPVEIYTEMLLRTMTCDGIVLCTYTPILGLTPVTVNFLREAVNRDQLPFKLGKDDKLK